MDGWDEYLENTSQVVADSLSTVQTNTDVVYQTLKTMGEEYSLSIAESLTSPWKDGESAIQSFSEKFGLSMSSTVEELQKVADEYKKIMDEIDGYGNKVVDQADNNASRYQGANNPSTPKFEDSETAVTPVSNSATSGTQNKPSLATGSYVEVKPGTRWYSDSYGGGASGVARSGTIKYINEKGTYPYNIEGAGWIKKTDIRGYKSGSTGVKKDQLALIDELGEELQLVPDGNGRLAYLKKGTAIIPHDISENLVRLGALDPQDILDRNRPTINAPHITNNETVINLEYGDILHIENFNGDKPEDLSKMIDRAFDKHMKQLNQQIRKFAR